MIVVLALSAMVGGAIAMAFGWQHGWLVGLSVAPVGRSLLAFALAASWSAIVHPGMSRTTASRSDEIPRGVIWC
jgi:hypothetical protein